MYLDYIEYDLLSRINTKDGTLHHADPESKWILLSGTTSSVATLHA